MPETSTSPLEPPPRSQPAKPARRRRGGQPGNTNAFRHGLYSAQFQPEELLQLDKNVKGELFDEIALMRIHLLHMAERLKDYSTMPLRDFISITNALSLLLYRLSHLTRTRQVVIFKNEENDRNAEFRRSWKAIVSGKS